MNHSASSLTSNNDSTYSDLELTTNKKTVGNKKQGNKNTRIADHVIIHNLSHEYTEINAPRMSSRPTRPSILHRTSSQTSECNTEEDSDEEQCLNRSFGNLQSKSQFRRSERGPFSWEQRQDKEFNNYHTMRRVDHRMSMSVRRGGSMYMPAQPAYLQNVETPPKKVSKSKLASIWRRLTGPPKRPQQIRREQHVEIQPPRISGLCSYGGIGLNFKRINRGDEITLVVVGASRCGKTSFIDNVTIVAAQTEGYSLIGPRERLCLSKIKPKSVPHMITLKWEDVKEGQQFVVDIVEAHLSPSGRTEKELMQPYLAAADAVLIIVNSSDNATLLSALSTSNILKNRGLPHVLIKNNFEVDAMQPTFVKKVVDAIGVRFYEQSLDKPTNEILMIIQNLVQTVVDKKVGHCKIWGTQE